LALSAESPCRALRVDGDAIAGGGPRLSLAESIAADLSYEAQLRRLASITGESWVHVDPNNVYDVNSLLHRNHLQSGRPGRFCEVLAPVQVAIIELVAGDWLANNGYGASG
jgi:hypothetical protein